ncbi:MAG TPA: protein-L-isoaspartate(D-aspartate) O-methyltransferase [Candidatus Krumholzibacteria bacterium]
MRWRQYKIARERMVREHVWARGIRDPRVIESMLRVPRHLFIGHDAGIEAYADHSYPIGFRQTMTQPYMVAYLCEQLRLDGDERVLEIGTGSGYHAAVLANLCREVCTVERVPELADRARAMLRDLLVTNVTVRNADGARGWDAGEFDRVLLTAAARHVPKALLAQVRDGGFLIGPVERSEKKQEVVRLTRRGGKFELERLIECSFVPLVRDAKPGARRTAAAAGGGS